ncbi:hypothetical protein [Burkholderia seminalis]|uniref:hypothetical protein n=1 Tax=Burkholderia seminalis TaxID=488731 RepID=UPI00265464C7|nr:hypothetical protein [Burkholderia seminalis]MDN7854030.1 hypothetical protein [Burkholderia seminalis]
MNTRHIQSFLIVSAAFFAMTGPVRAQGASALAAAGAQPSAERAVESKANAR